MSQSQTNHDQIRSIALNGTKTRENAQAIYDTLVRGWDLPETYIGDGQVGVPLSQFKHALWESDQRVGIEDDDETRAERLYGTRHPFLAASLIGPDYEFGSDRAADAEAVVEHTRDATPDSERAIVDSTIVKDASPIEVDPMIVDIQRSNAPVLDIIPSVAQAGFTAQYNQFTGRTLDTFFVTESTAMALGSETGSSFTVDTNTKDMQIMATLVDVSDFAQRAEETLDYMNLMDTTVGQVMKEIFITKAGAFFYGDTNTTAGSVEWESSEGYDGLARFASVAGQATDKTSQTSGRLEDMLDYLTTQVTSSGLTFGRARFLVSPQFYNAIYDEVTPVVRIDGYDADVEFGPQGLAIGHERGSVPISPCDNIRDYSSNSQGVGSDSTVGDVFLIDEQAIQFRQLAPMSTVPLSRVGLADRAAIFEYGTLIDKSLDESNGAGHTHRLKYGSNL